MILTIARKELKSLFASPLAWVVLAFVQVILSFAFLKRLDDYLQVQAQLAQMPNPPGFTELVAASVYATFAVVMLFAVPLLAMRLIAEERRNRTMALLVSAPISMSEIVLGKFCGLLAFLCLIAGVATLMPLSLLLGGNLDLGLLACLLMGTILLAASFSAVCLYASCLTAHPLAAAMAGFGLLVAMVLAGDAAVDGLQARGWLVPAALAQVLSPLKNFEVFSKGLIDTYSVACIVLLTVAFLALAIRRLESARLRG
jgi:ABC-2 type transport system permease protein